MSPTKKPIISVYARRLIKQHVGYFIALVLFVVLLATFIPYQIRDYLSVRDQLAQANESINDHNIRRSVIQKYPVEQLNDLVLTMNTMYPSVEDRFSIFTSIENLEGVTGIDIDTYSSPFAGATADEISIGIKADASLDTYRTFLRNYLYRSGRFMTIEKVAYNAKAESLSFTAKFHSKHVEIGDQVASQYSPDAIDRLIEIQKEIESAGLIKRDISKTDEEIPVDYSTKTNPFD